MMATELVADLARQNVHLFIDGDNLRIRAPKGVLTAELCEELTSRKTEVLDLLRSAKTSAGSMSQITPDLDHCHHPFPLTDIQQAYWLGRSGALELGKVACHAYYEVEAERLDIGRLNRAFQLLITRHDMLRAVVLPDGRQKVLKEVPPYSIEVTDLRGEELQEPSYLEETRCRMSYQVLPSDQWPLFEVRASILKGHRIRLHLSFDMLIVDVWSLQILFSEWQQLYRDLETELVPLEISFRDYVLAELELRESGLYRRSEAYWAERLSELPAAPDLPLAADHASLNEARFVRHSGRLDQSTWLRLKGKALDRGLTPSGLLLAAFAEILTAWSKRPRFTINVTLSNRLPLHPQVNSILGDFTNPIPVEVNNSAQESFEARSARLQLRLLDDAEHCHLGGIQIMRQVARAQGSASAIANPIVFTSLLGQRSGGGKINRTLWMGDVVYGITQTPQVWLDHQVSEDEGALAFNWDAVENIFPEGLLHDLFGAYVCFLNRLADDDSAWTDSVRDVLPPAQLSEREAINNTDAVMPDGLLHTMFCEQVKQRPDRMAVVSSGRSLTYEQLRRLSNQAALWLKTSGAVPNALVAIVMEKGWEQVVSTLAVLKSGAAYLPINPQTPKERLWYLLEHGQVNLVLTQTSTDQSLEWPDHISRLRVDDMAQAALSDESPETCQSPEDLAYVIYTSGSTGLPKGVMINHRGAVNTIADVNRRFGVNANDNVLALSDLSFDLSVYDIFGILASGGTVIVPDSPAMRDPAHWLELIERENVTVWNSVPALLSMLLDYLRESGKRLPASLRLFLLSGDWISVTLPEKVYALAPAAQVVSLGGATEASIWSIYYPIKQVDSDWKSIPYGKPMANQKFHVLNELLEPCPVWVPGQLYISGRGVALGYWRDEEKTRARFIIHPRTGERLYKTGDLGRYLPDGNIEFLGREDFQVKIQGYRIELGEIEAAIAQHPSVRAVIVKAVGKSRELNQLVAYFTADRESAPGSSELKDFLRSKLPGYMAPSRFVMLEEIPLTANGKLDRMALACDTEPASGFSHGAAVEMSLIQKMVADAVASTLELDIASPHSNLLEAGASSVDMVRIANVLEKQFDFRPNIKELYEAPTVAGMARAYEKFLLQSHISGKSAARGRLSGGNSASNSTEMLLDQTQREEFKKQQPGLRPRENNQVRFQLTPASSEVSVRARCIARQSHRRFSKRSIAFEAFSEFIGCLRQVSLNGKPKRQYASAGGLYPAQVFLHIKAGGVETIPGGIYYYDPAADQLVLVSKQATLDPTIHEPSLNRPMFQEVAFSIFLIAELNAIAPLYGEWSMHFATLEAGLITQLLEMAAPANQIGVCQIGGVDFESIRHLFALSESQMFIHSLVGGPIEEERSEHWLPLQEAYCSNDVITYCDEGEV